MRIRKNRKFSSLVFPHGVQQPHICLLNQSPWDAIPFSQETYHSVIHQFERDNSFDGNNTLLDSVQVVKRENEAAKMQVDVKNEIEKIPAGKEKVLDDNEEMEVEKEFNFCCNEKETKQAHSMCDHRLSCVKSSTNNSKVIDSCSVDLTIKKNETVTGRGRGKRERSGSSNRHEFYYYSGFGPLWGKKRDRGEGNKSKGKDSEIIVGGAINSIGA